MTDLPRDEKTERKKGLAIHFATEIHSDRADVPMIACCFVSGLIDSAAYNAWTCFVSMQTGKPQLPHNRISTSMSLNLCYLDTFKIVDSTQEIPSSSVSAYPTSPPAVLLVGLDP